MPLAVVAWGQEGLLCGLLAVVPWIAVCPAGRPASQPLSAPHLEAGLLLANSRQLLCWGLGYA